MDNQVVLLTGGSSGIGLELSYQLMMKGMRVYSASRSIVKPSENLHNSGEIIPVCMDVNNEYEISSTLSSIIEANGRLDILICNAGNGIAGAVEETSIDESLYQFETNFFGAVKTIRACLPIFRQQNYGKILVNSSMAAITPIPFQAFYSASKSALFTLMQSLSMEVSAFGVQCCTVLTGNAKTNFTAARKYTLSSYSPTSPYKNAMGKSVANMENDEKNGMQASFIARKMLRQLTRKRMKEIIVPGNIYKIIYWLFNRAPMKLRLWLVKRVY